MKASDKLKTMAQKVAKVESQNPKAFDWILEEIPRIIKVRTRLGKGLLGKLNPLSLGYVKQRARFKKHGDLSSETTIDKSNLTQTGEMLDSIIGERSGNIFTFFFSNKESSDKARWADEGGRPFFDLLPSEEKGLRRRISAIIREELRKIFKN